MLFYLFTFFFILFLTVCQVKEDKNKKHLPPTNTVNNKKLKLTAANKINNNYNQNYKISNANSAIPKNTNFKNCDVLGSGINNIMERMERLKLNPQPVPSELKKFVPSSTTNLAELTTPTAIQINQAVNQLSSHPTFPNNFDLENIKLPPGITITKVDPATVQRKPIQVWFFVFSIFYFNINIFKFFIRYLDETTTSTAISSTNAYSSINGIFNAWFI